MPMSLQDSYGEALISTVMVLGGGAFGKWLGFQGSPTPHPWLQTSTDQWPVRNPDAQQGVSSGQFCSCYLLSFASCPSPCPVPPFMEKLSSMKPIPAAKKVGDRWMRLWGWSPHDGIVSLSWEKGTRASSLPCKNTARRWPLVNQEKALSRYQIRWSLDLGLSASRTVINKCLLFKSPSLWYFVLAAQAGWDSNHSKD